uniref:Tetratricopeptide repeat domain 9B n=1 Tax=Oryctolagus cuniculus TaxID=9986 RepID=A0A5F9D908_RABIT
MLSAAPEPPPRPPPALSPPGPGPGPGPRHGSARPGPAPEPSGGLAAALDSSLRAAVAFKAEGQRCYREKKFREAIGKYHRALLQLKAAQGARPGGLPAPAPGPSASPGPARLSEEQQRLVESTEVECYDSLTGTGPSGGSEGRVKAVCVQGPGRGRQSRRRAPPAAGPGPWGRGHRGAGPSDKALPACPADTNVLRYIQLTQLKMSRCSLPEGEMP